MKAGPRHSGPRRVNVTLAVGHHRHPPPSPGQALSPTPALSWPAPLFPPNAAIPAPTADDPGDALSQHRRGCERRPPTRPKQARLTASTAIPRLRRGRLRMRHDPVGVAFLHRSQAAAALRGGGEFHLRGVPRDKRPGAGSGSPAHAGRRQPRRSVCASLRRSSPPSLSGWRKTDPLAVHHHG
jgi:hypothetical protein